MKSDLYFVGSVPEPSINLGFKMFGQNVNDWLSDCQPDEWCTVESMVQVTPGGDGDHCLLIFDSMDGPRQVYIKNLIAEIYDEQPVFPADNSSGDNAVFLPTTDDSTFLKVSENGAMEALQYTVHSGKTTWLNA